MCGRRTVAWVNPNRHVRCQLFAPSWLCGQLLPTVRDLDKYSLFAVILPFGNTMGAIPLVVPSIPELRYSDVLSSPSHGK
jgi:hypothetical protein